MAQDDKVGSPGGSGGGSTGPRTRLSDAMERFRLHMVVRGFARNTIKAFMGDLGILSAYIGTRKHIGNISTHDLTDFMDYLLNRRGKPCSPKSYARRLTTLKVFFGWLAENGYIGSDPAQGLVHLTVTTPLPQILHDDEIARLLNAARDIALAIPNDSRPYLLLSLILQTGIKKGECMAIQVRHIDLSNPQAPVLEIRHRNPRTAHKDRRLSLSPQLVPILQQYLRQYEPKERLFECTARNLEYVLRKIANAASVSGGVSFEQLRWTCAVRDFRRGMPEETLRQKLGLSAISWRESAEKIKKLAGPAF